MLGNICLCREKQATDNHSQQFGIDNAWQFNQLQMIMIRRMPPIDNDNYY